MTYYEEMLNDWKKLSSEAQIDWFVEELNTSINNWMKADSAVIRAKIFLYLILEAGTDVNIKENIAIRTAVKCAVGKRDGYIIVKRLIDAGADVTNEALMTAIEKYDVEMVKLLISAGADVTAEGDRVLERAAQMGDIEIINLIIDSGAKITTNVIRAAAKNERHEEVFNFIMEKLKTQGEI